MIDPVSVGKKLALTCTQGTKHTRNCRKAQEGVCVTAVPHLVALLGGGC